MAAALPDDPSSEMRTDLIAKEIAAEPDAADQDRKTIWAEQAEYENEGDENPHQPV
ncbi:hypothetical protein [Bosea sp. BIWAKO-01]|uniref:hypothetical protein n=1 Tax=Bosea sp. BIWAKO-01 TaxID=506668 RepID=UPI00159F0E85|nr:hypothetical protein [Bosea sp. BIWAKO-01]